MSWVNDATNSIFDVPKVVLFSARNGSRAGTVSSVGLMGETTSATTAKCMSGSNFTDYGEVHATVTLLRAVPLRHA